VQMTLSSNSCVLSW